MKRPLLEEDGDEREEEEAADQGDSAAGDATGDQTSRKKKRPFAPRWANMTIPKPGIGSDAYFRSLYTSAPNFRHLASRDNSFKAVLTNGQLDFADAAAVKQLTRTLLKLDFGLELTLPDDRLCPPVPNRHNYILWLKDLMDTTSYDEAGAPMIGFDIGTGSSCIYPLLACAQRPWQMLASDIDPTNHGFARRNIVLNNLSDRITMIPLRSATDPLIPVGIVSPISRPLDFVMTNPPFFASVDDMAAGASNKALPPASACTGAAVEMITDGGEVGFVRRILDESLGVRERVRWYTAMLGKASSVEAVVALLRDSGIDNFAVTELVQGMRTRRWAIGWSFGAMRPSEEVARGVRNAAWGRLLPPAVDVEIFRRPVRDAAAAESDVGDLADRVDNLMSTMDLLSWSWDRQRLRGRGRAPRNVWGRAWRRRRNKEPNEGRGQADDLERVVVAAAADGGACLLGFQLAVLAESDAVSITCRWSEGHDHGLFESFWHFVRGKTQSWKPSPTDDGETHHNEE